MHKYSQGQGHADVELSEEDRTAAVYVLTISDAEETYHCAGYVH